MTQRKRVILHMEPDILNQWVADGEVGMRKDGQLMEVSSFVRRMYFDYNSSKKRRK